MVRPSPASILDAARVAVLAVGLLHGAAGTAGTLDVRILAVDGEPAENAVVVAYPLDTDAAASEEIAQQLSSMSQKEQVFDPHLLVVRRGARVSFPNLDETRHHVYSFSEAKRFELKLYLGEPVEPVQFDVAGIVTLGCNIHDWMLGYVVVVDSPYFGKSATDGRVTLTLPAGRYRLWAWHPRIAESESLLDETLVIDRSRSVERLLRIDQPTVAPPAPKRALGLPVSVVN